MAKFVVVKKVPPKEQIDYAALPKIDAKKLEKMLVSMALTSHAPISFHK